MVCTRFLPFWHHGSLQLPPAQNYGHALAAVAGDGSQGQLGTIGNVTITDVPVEVAAGRLFKEVLACGLHTCGIAELGRTICWGEIAALAHQCRSN